MTNRVTETAGRAGAYASEKLHDATTQVRETAEAARAAAGDAYEAARQRAAAARRKGADGVEENPVAALVGGLAIGAVIGALLPRTRRETETLGPLGSKINEAARNAVSAARDAGREKLDELGVSREAAQGQVDKLLDVAVKTASSAGSAAAGAVRGR